MAWRASYMLWLFPHILGNHGNDDDDNEDHEDEDDGGDDAHQGGGGGGPGATPLQRHTTCAQEPISEQVKETN